MVDIAKNVGVGVSTEVLDSFPNELNSAIVRCLIYQRSTSYTWNGSAFASGSTYTAMTRVTGKTWRCTYTPDISGTYIISIEVEGNLRNIQYHYAQGGVVSASVGTGWNLSQLRTLFKRITKDKDRDNSEIDDYLNLAIQDIGGEEKGHWRFLEDNSSFSTADDDANNFNSLGTTVNEIITMYITSPAERKLERYPGDWQAFIREYPKHTDTGTPTIYVPYGIDANGNYQIFLYVIPSTTMTVKYDFYKKIGSLSADGDVPEIPQIFQPVILFRAVWYHSLTRDVNMATFMDNLYEKGIEKMKLWHRNKLDIPTDDIPRHDRGGLDLTIPVPDQNDFDLNG